MVGRTSGRQGGELLDDCTDNDASDGVFWLCMGKADYESDIGDSGAPVVFFKFPYQGDVELHQGDVELPIGVHKGENGFGDAFFSNIYLAFDEIEADLGSDTLCISLFSCPFAFPPDTISVSIDGPSEVPTNAGEACSWSANVSGAEGGVSYEWKWDSQVVSTEDFYVSDEGTEGTYWLEVMVADTMFTDMSGMSVQVDDAYSCE